MKLKKEWFEEWFDSPYYHLIYKHRDDFEAAEFLNKVAALLNIAPQAKVLDLACGKGRHAIHLSKLGLDVIGLDLSQKNIANAHVMSNEKLHFYVHDMRNMFRSNYFDFIFNLFTSFGYFKNNSDDLRVLQNVNKSLVKGGNFIFDFLNIEHIKHLKETIEEREEEGIHFKIRKHIRQGSVIKSISFQHLGVDYEFEEQVKLIDQETFKTYFKKADLEIIHTFGDYNLNPFEMKHSDRLIIIARKN